MKSIYLSILISLSTLSVIAQDEAVIYSFKTRNNKIVQFIYNETDSIFKYRLLSRGKIKLEVVDDLKDIDTVFTVHGYHRGGGVQNSAMLTDMCRQPEVKSKMKKILSIIVGILMTSWSNGQTLIAKNGHESNKIQFAEEQTEMIYEKIKMFPENTQLSIAIIDSGKVNFLGIKRFNDSIVQVENHQSIFEIGSMSKVFTATLLSNFVLNNQLKLESSIQDYLSFEMNTRESITFKELANHTSGLPRLPSNLNLLLVDQSNPYKSYDEEKLKTYLTEKIVLNQKPGTVYEYSNLGAGLLGYILATYSKSSLEELLNELIFSKYNMLISTSDRTKIKSGLIKGLDTYGKETSNWDLNVLAGAGGILSSVQDLSKFALAQFDNNYPELQLTHQPTFTISETMQIGLGWHIIKASAGMNEVIWHNGGTGGYTSSMALDLKNKCGIIILSNVSAFNKNMREIDNLCFGLIKIMQKLPE